MSFKKSYANEEWAKNAQNQQTEHLHTFQSQLKLPFSEPPPQPKALFLDKNQHDHHNGCKKQTKHKQLKEIAQAKKKTGSNFRECFLVKAKEGNIKSLQSSQLHSAPQSKLEVGRM
jgi:hypothetical protein